VPIPRSAPTRRLPPGARRAALLTALEDAAAPSTVAGLAEATGLHPNTVRAHLDVLVREGRATRRTEQRAARGRPRELYEATGAPDPATAYASLALLLAEQLASATADPAREGERMGHRWAAADAAPGATGEARDGVVEVLRVLRRAGFGPELSAEGSQVLLHSCPVRQVAHAQPDVVCQAHLGLIRATLESAGSPVVATAIAPFVEPELCVASLTRPDAGPVSRPPAGPLGGQ
jgi:predicted ArsR family transcriptional regulator